VRRGAPGSPELGVSRFTYEPGARMPWGHRHKQRDEVYVVVAGPGQATLGEIIAIGTWDILRVAPAVMRSFEAGPGGMEIICIGGKPGGDTERDEACWP
jgi:mannose-6-phosphate isomerase-like protein (cupin superfamily)